MEKVIESLEDDIKGNVGAIESLDQEIADLKERVENLQKFREGNQIRIKEIMKAISILTKGERYPEHG